MTHNIHKINIKITPKIKPDITIVLECNKADIGLGAIIASLNQL